MRPFVISLALAGLAVGCGETTGETDANVQDEIGLATGDAYVAPFPGTGIVERWKFELMREDRSFNFNLQSTGVEAFAPFFTPDGAMIQAGVGEIRGRAAIDSIFRAAVADDGLFRLVWEPERAEVSNGGDLGYTTGTYQSVTRDSVGVLTTVSGKYVSIWRRQDDGTWRVEMDLGNPVTQPEVVPTSTDIGDLRLGPSGQANGPVGRAPGSRTP